MATVTVDIHNRCKRKCRCTQNRQFLTGSVGIVAGNLDFRHCTHRATGGAKIADATWNGETLEVLKYIDQFKDVDSITTYYYSKHVISTFIKKPLLIRVKRYYGKVYWYENLGHSANKKWRRLSYKEIDRYPIEDKYTPNSQLETKLKAVACRLHVSHAVRIDSIDDHTSVCRICNQSISVKVNEYPVNGVQGYKRCSYISGDISERSILVYQRNQLTFRKRSPIGGTGYYLPIQLDSIIATVNVYYWDKDANRDNPLLLELAGGNGVSYWFENIGGPGGEYGKWKYVDPFKPGGNLDNPVYRVNRLDVLNCVYNRVIQINIGTSKDCHNKDHTLHKGRISRSYKEVPDTHPLLYAYEYQPSNESEKKPFNISEITVIDKKQKFPNVLPLTNVTKLTAYASPCNGDKPFLICVESSGNIDKNGGYTWYVKKEEPGSWGKYTFSGLSPSPDNAKGKVGNVLTQFGNNLGIGKCYISTSSKGIKLNIRRVLDDKDQYITYYDLSDAETRKVPIFVTKSKENLALGFFRNIHGTTEQVFTLNRELADKNNIGAGSKAMSGVQNVYAYFWDGEKNTPILVGVKQSTGDTLYGKGKGGNFWGHDQVEGLDELQALDHQNCLLNNAIPIDLSNPRNVRQFKFDKQKSSCLNDKFVKQSTDLSLPDGAKDAYEVKAYQLTDDKRISRVTYKYKPTNIVPQYQEKEPILHLYSWKKKHAPLLVEFKPKAGGQSIWYENLGVDQEHTKWRKITNADELFYNKGGRIPELNETFTRKLYEVNCIINGVVQLEISKTNEQSYCHGITAEHSKRIQVTKERDNRYEGFVGYEHTPTDQTPFTISSMYYRTIEQKLHNGVKRVYIENISKVTVYFPICPFGVPIAMHIETSVGNKWFKRTSVEHTWENSMVFDGKGEDEIMKVFGEITNEIYACNSSKRSLLPQSPSQVPNIIPWSTIKSGDEDAGLPTLKDLFADSTDTDDQVVDNIFGNDEHENENVKKDVEVVTLVNAATAATAQVQSLSSGVSAVPIPQPAVALPHGLTIDIKQNPFGEHGTGSSRYKVDPPSGDGKDVDLDKTEDPPGFYRFTHTSADLTSFGVKKVQYNDQERDEIKPDGQVESYSVWYWKYDKDMKEPLLVEMENYDETYTYKSNKGNWSGWNNPYGRTSYDTHELLGEDLEQVLDDINCYNNNAVTIDLSFASRNNGTYCCRNHGTGNGRVRVALGSVKVISKSNVAVQYSQIEYSIHTINRGPDTKLTKIKYYLEGKQNERKRITAPELNFPIKGPVDVYVYYCNNIPALIYVKKSGGRTQGENQWYSRESENSHNWVHVTFTGIKPDDVNNKNCNNWNQVKNILNKLGCDTGKCTNNLGTIAFSSSSIVSSAGSSTLDMVIELKYKPTGGTSTTHKYRDAESQKEITVTRTSYQTNFLKYIHVNSISNGGSFTLKAVRENDTGDIVTGLNNVKDVSSVSAYYWQHDKGGGQTPSRVLLVEVAQNDSSIGSEYSYYVKRNGNWSDYDLKGSPGGPTKEELDLLNCEINDVVQIDVMKTSDYCHNGNDHMPTKVKVSEISDASKLGNYRAFEHSPSNGPFIISEFKKGNDYITLDSLEPDLPLRNTNRVIVYFCMSDFGDPLLVHLPSVNQGKGWFQKPTDDTNDWKPVTSLNGKNKNDSDYDAIVNFLDTINSPCKPPEVTIDIYSRSVIRHSTIHGNPFTMEVKNDQRNINGFTEYVHTIHGRTKGYFTVKEFHYNYERVEGKLGSTEKVTHVSVFYWNSLEESNKSGNTRGRPLLLKIIKNRKSPLYYENTNSKGNTNWQHTVVYPENLQRRLHLLNCKLNNAVVIDVSKQDESYDACDIKSIDPSHGDRMQVSENQSTSDRRLGSYEVYTHKLRTPLGSKFHIVSFKNNDTPINIGQTPNIPILDVSEVKVYRCDQDNKPLLIYYTTDGTSHNWYKNSDSEDSDSGKWVPVPDLSSTEPTQHENIKKVLDSLDSKCKPEDPKREKFVGAIGGAATGAMSFGAISGISSGTLAGAGSLTGLGWWAFKRSKGDPWVRQI